MFHIAHCVYISILTMKLTRYILCKIHNLKNYWLTKLKYKSTVRLIKFRRTESKLL